MNSSCRGLVGSRLLEQSLDLVAALPDRRLVGQVRFERQGGLHQVVGQQPCARVPHLGLDDRRAPGDLGLSAQRFELATDLGDQVSESVEVALGRVELPKRLLLALAMFEYAGCLLDEATAALGRRLQDRVELALPDDDMHLPPDA